MSRISDIFSIDMDRLIKKVNKLSQRGSLFKISDKNFTVGELLYILTGNRSIVTTQLSVADKKNYDDIESALVFLGYKKISNFERALSHMQGG